MVSLCMMIKNEAQFLDFCLRQLRGSCDELVVIDTGSRDGSLSIAASHGARIYHHELNDDFARARNRFFDYAGKRWILVLDGDEFLHRPKCTEFLAGSGGVKSKDGFFLPRIHYLGSGHFYTDMILRLFRNDPSIRYSGRIFEGVKIPQEQTGYYHEFIHHLGYVKSPETVAPKMKGYIGKALLKIGEDRAALDGKVEFIELFSMLAVCHLYEGRKDEARAVCEEGAKEKEAPWFYIILGGLAQSDGDYDEAERQFEAGIEFCESHLGRSEPGGSQAAYFTLFKYKLVNKLGLLFSATGRHGAAEDAFDKAESIFPGACAALINKGCLYHKTGLYRKAAECFQTAIERNRFLADPRIQSSAVHSPLLILSDVDSELRDLVGRLRYCLRNAVPDEDGHPLFSAHGAKGPHADPYSIESCRGNSLRGGENYGKDAHIR